MLKRKTTAKDLGNTNFKIKKSFKTEGSNVSKPRKFYPIISTFV